MARDETARERDSEQSLLDQRSYLRLAGTAAATVAGTDVAGEHEEHRSNGPQVPEVNDGGE